MNSFLTGVWPELDRAVGTVAVVRMILSDERLALGWRALRNLLVPPRLTSLMHNFLKVMEVHH
jgi:hypothetical protein